MNWVEKSSFEKISRLSEISEHERNYKVLLTLDNISAVRSNPAHLHPQGHSPTVVFEHCGRGAFCHC